MYGKNVRAIDKLEKNECGCLDTGYCPPARNVTHPLRYYEFTAEEIKALEECDKESFYRRCLPLSTAFATVVYTGMKFGFLSRNPHFGVWPKVAAAVVTGHVAGRLIYLSNCEAKLRRLPPNSYLGNVMRRYYEENNKPADPKKKK